MIPSYIYTASTGSSKWAKRRKHASLLSLLGTHTLFLGISKRAKKNLLAVDAIPNVAGWKEQLAQAAVCQNPGPTLHGKLFNSKRFESMAHSH